MNLQHIKKPTRCLVGLAAGVTLLITACSGAFELQQDQSDYQDQIDVLQTKLADSPDDAIALRDLGVIHVKTKEYAEGRALLERAQARAPDDPQTLLFLGLAIESLGDPHSALAIYQRFGMLLDADGDRSSSYIKLMEARYRRLGREVASLDVARLVAIENTLTTADISPRTVGVFALSYRGQDPAFEPLGRGLSELLSIDLSKVEELSVVERVRLQVLVDELALAQSDAVDPATAPRIGKLLHAGTVVGGNFDIFDGNDLQLNVATLDIVNDVAPPVATETDALTNLFRMEKDIVFSVIDDMGIDLTEAERAAIEVIPTQNLQAFLAFGRGLIQEDAGHFEEAAAFFQQAAGLDPSFELASDKAASAATVSAAGGGAAAPVLAEAFALSGLISDPFQVDTGALVNARLQNLGAGVRSNFTPSADNRDPLEEAVEAGVEAGELPAPPPPPPVGN